MSKQGLLPIPIEDISASLTSAMNNKHGEFMLTDISHEQYMYTRWWIIVMYLSLFTYRTTYHNETKSLGMKKKHPIPIEISFVGIFYHVSVIYLVVIAANSARYRVGG